MHRTKMFSILVGLAIIVGVTTFPVLAAPHMQGGNLLQDPTFDLAAQGNWKWERWSYQVEIMKADSKKDPDLNQSFYAPSFLPSQAKWDHTSGGQSGAAADVSGRTYTKFRGGLYQTVNVGKGTRVRFSIWANESCEGSCPVLLKAGIDPTGGTDWNSGNIKWAGAQVSNSKYVHLVTEEVTAGDSGNVTVFTWGEPDSPAINTAAYFDDAALTVAASSAAPTGAAPAATLQPGQPTPTAQPGVCAQLRWSADVTIPDDMAMAPGTQFVKTWRVKNNGTCAFSGTLNFIGTGNQMSGSSPVTLPKVEAGQQADVSVNLTAPTQPGNYHGTWQPRTTDGTAMENLVVRITVSANAPTPPVVGVTATPQPQASPTPPVSPIPATGQVCVLAYDDASGDGQRGEAEALLAGAVFVLADAQGPMDSYTTDGASEPHCFADLPLGNYQLTIKPPAGYASTTFDSMNISLAAGMKPSVLYGAKHSGPASTPTRPSGATNGSATAGGLLGSIGRTILIVVGVLVLVGLAGIGGFLLLSRRAH